MKILVFSLILLVTVCFPAWSDDPEHVDTTKLVKDVASALAKGISDKIKGFFGSIVQMVKSKEGTFTIDGTKLVLKFHAHSCNIKIGRKRMLLGKHIKCEAVVKEELTGTEKTCIKDKQMKAVECAAKAVLEEIKNNAILGKLNTKNLVKQSL